MTKVKALTQPPSPLGQGYPIHCAGAVETRAKVDKGWI